MVLPLYGGALDEINGVVYFSEVMESDEAMLEEFDKGFPYKEKKVQESQLQFEAAVSELDTKNYD